MNKYKVTDPNLARLVNTFSKLKDLKYSVLNNEEYTVIYLCKKDAFEFAIRIYDNNQICKYISYLITLGDDSYDEGRISILPIDSKILDGFGLFKAHCKMCKIIGKDVELSDDVNCVLKIANRYCDKLIDERHGISFRGKRRSHLKMKPYHLAFQDISFKDVRSKVKSNESLIKKYFVISNYAIHFLKVDFALKGIISSNVCHSKKQLYSFINRTLQNTRDLTPVSEWQSEMPIQGSSNVGLKSIQSEMPILRASDRTATILVEPAQTITQFIDEIIPKNTNSFKHPNPRIINKKQLQNYVSEYNNDRGFYEYLSTSSNSQP